MTIRRSANEVLWTWKRDLVLDMLAVKIGAHCMYFFTIFYYNIHTSSSQNPYFGCIWKKSAEYRNTIPGESLNQWKWMTYNVPKAPVTMTTQIESCHRLKNLLDKMLQPLDKIPYLGTSHSPFNVGYRFHVKLKFGIIFATHLQQSASTILSKIILLHVIFMSHNL